MFDPGSFRDRSSRVFHRDGRVFRALNESAARQWNAARQTSFVPRQMDAGRIIRTTEASVPPPVGDSGAWTTILEHDRVPFVSYPYEWSFSMLQDAARLQLELLDTALCEQTILKDATPYNVQFIDAQPVFIDVASFERLAPGDVWAGYRQFCQLFLFPLMLQAYRGVDFQPLLRGSLEGIDPETMRRQLSVRDLLRPGVLAHVSLHARLQRRFGSASGDTRSSLRTHGFNSQLIMANVRSLKRLVERLRWRPMRSMWSAYDSECPHVQRDAAAKETFVRDVTGSRRRQLVWDLGCNVGRYSRIAAESAECVVAMDGDHRTIDDLYCSLIQERCRGVLPLVVDLADPSPGRGWRGRERLDLASRGRPDLTLCLAVLHHLVIGRNLPLRDVIDWLGELGTELVIEFVSRDDPQTQSLLRNRPDQYGDYTLERFERLLQQHFRIVRREQLPSQTRFLIFATPLRPQPETAAH